jgi:hypothetical protein
MDLVLDIQQKIFGGDPAKETALYFLITQEDLGIII